MAKKQNITLAKEEAKQHLKPYCEQAEKAAEYKRKADELRPLAAEELQEKLDNNPDTKDFTGTVVYLCDDKAYKIRVQRKSSCNWREKRLDDPLLKNYKDLMDTIDGLKETAKQMEDDLAKAHPKCVKRELSIAFLSK